ncbi:MAG TPA: ABC transporter permease [Gemmatimonadaceae bacterium]|nr:ABC transporter permease [Gemmatimonadaceae bacterium]
MASRELTLSGSFTAIGGKARGTGSDVAEGIRFIGSCARAVASFPRNARSLSRRQMRLQVRFTAVDAMPIISGLALLIGALVIAQAHAQAVRFGVSEALGQLLATIIVRELGPLFAAIIVVARSGTAIASELATSRVMGEVTALEALGVDPVQYLVLPRLVAVAISVALLAMYFDFIAIMGGLVATSYLAHLPPGDYLESLRMGMSSLDIVLVVVKGALFGFGTAAICCWAGLRAARTPAAIPQGVTRGVVLAMVYVFAISAAFTIGQALWTS